MHANEFHPLLYDRGRGPELQSTRVTIYNVLHELMDPDVTEAELCRRYQITPHEVAVLRAFVLTNHAAVMAKNAEIEERIRRGVEAQDTPAFRERSAATRDRLRLFKLWLDECKLNPDLFPEVAVESPADHQARMWAAFDEWKTSHIDNPIMC